MVDDAGCSARYIHQTAKEIARERGFDERHVQFSGQLPLSLLLYIDSIYTQLVR